jgi:pimeloyl-ACP methyl ester carboxylesterase
MISLGMHYTVQCQEEYISASHRDYAAIIDAYPHLDAYMRYPVEGMATVDRLCDMWQAEPRDPIANLPVYSDIPTLLLSGNFDPITPPAYAESVHATLEQSYNVVFPYVSHGVLRSDPCAVDIAQAFIGAPDVPPDSACITDTQPMQFD